MKVRRLGPQIGAEIEGVDITKLDDAGFAGIYRAWLDHNVVVVPGQQLEILGAPPLEVREPRQVGREVAREQADLAVDRVPQSGYAAEALARDEAEVGVVPMHVADEDLD